VTAYLCTVAEIHWRKARLSAFVIPKGAGAHAEHIQVVWLDPIASLSCRQLDAEPPGRVRSCGASGCPATSPLPVLQALPVVVLQCESRKVKGRYAIAFLFIPTPHGCTVLHALAAVVLRGRDHEEKAIACSLHPYATQCCTHGTQSYALGGAVQSSTLPHRSTESGIVLSLWHSTVQ